MGCGVVWCGVVLSLYCQVTVEETDLLGNTVDTACDVRYS